VRTEAGSELAIGIERRVGVNWNDLKKHVDVRCRCGE
jgi:hypothetical protein